MRELKERRKRLNLSQAELANFLTIALKTYEKIEAGSRPVPKTQAHKLKLFNVVSNEDVLMGIYHGETIFQVYKKACRDSLLL